MISLLKFVEGDWEYVRGYLKADLEHIQEAINQHWTDNFGGDSTLTAGTIAGDPTPATRYVANTGPNNSPKWDQVNLANGVKGRLPFEHLPTVDNETLLGRRNGANGDIEQIAVGTNLSITGGPTPTLNATGSGDVNGPGSSVDGTIALFDGTGGDSLREATGSGIVKAVSGVYNTISIPSDADQFLNGAASPAYQKPTTRITGTATNNNATAGDIGEVISGQLSSGAPTSLSNGTAKNVTSMSLTAGDWDVTGVVDYVLAGTTSTKFQAGSSSTSATFGAQDTSVNVPLILTTVTDTYSQIIPTTRFSLASTTTVYLVAQATFSAGTVDAYGTIRARRMR